MNKFSAWIKPLLFPNVDKKTALEIDTMNTRNIHYVSLVVGIVQLISLIVFSFINFGSAVDDSVICAVLRVGSSVILCVLGFVISGVLLKKPDTVKNHPLGVRLFIGGFIILMMIWSIFVAVYNYANYQQMLTFYTVELMAVLFVKLKPAFTTTIITSSYIATFLILHFGVRQDGINLYNFMMLAILSVAGAVLNYRLTANYIAEKNKASILNESLEIIANHDSITRLQNRYALNQHFVDFVDRDICIAMGDINSFKAVNDTYGHRVGDDVLKLFSDILLEFFPAENVFRYGGDEFLIIAESDSLDDFRKRFDQVNERFSSTRIAGVETRLGCSFGCIKFHPMSPAEFFDGLTSADKILYEEKKRLSIKR